MAKKRFDYFDYFKDVSEIICEASQELFNALHDFKTDDLQAKLDLMHEIEHHADCAKHEMTKLLAHEFITPIEREDIVSLAQGLDNVVDNIEDVLLRIYMFNVAEIKPEAIEFSEIIIKCTKELNAVLTEFKNFKHSNDIKTAMIAVGSYETEGDKLLANSIRNLACTNASDRELFIWTDIYEQMEECLDACEKITDIIESVIMKNT